MIYFAISLLLGVAWLSLFCWVLCKDLSRCEDPIRRIVFCATLAILFKADFGLTFWGLEYEDSYVFHHCAQMIAHNILPHSFLVEGIVAGSLDNPLSTGTYSGHFIMLPAILSVLYRIFGDTFRVFSIFETAVSFLMILTLSIWNLRSEKGWWMAPAVYCSYPIINVFSNTGLCETLSGLTVLSFVFSFLRAQDVNEKCRRRFELLAIVSFFMAIMTKRDNLVIALFPMVYWLCQICCARRLVGVVRNVKWNAILASIVVAYLVFIQNVFGIEMIDAEDISCATFSIVYFKRLFPRFISVLFDIRFFYLAVPSLIVVCLICSHRRIVKCDLFSILVLLVLFLLMYSSHFRGYDLVKGGESSAFDTFRYFNNFSFLLAAPFCYIQFRLSHKAMFLTPLVMAYPFCQTVRLRNELSAVEYRERFDACTRVRSFLRNQQKEKFKPVIVTDDELLYLVAQKDECDVCSLREYSAMIESYDERDVYLVADRLEETKRRYHLSIDMSGFSEVKAAELGNMKLWKRSNGAL